MNVHSSINLDSRSGRSSTTRRKKTGFSTKIDNDFKKLSIMTHNSNNVISEEVLNKEISLYHEISSTKEGQEIQESSKKISLKVDNEMLKKKESVFSKNIVGGDLNKLVLSQKVAEALNEKIKFGSRGKKSKWRRVYNFLHIPRYFLVILTFISLFFSKPGWCKQFSRENGYDQELKCSMDPKRDIYYSTTDLGFLPGWVIFAICNAYFICCIQSFHMKMKFAKRTEVDKIKVKQIIQYSITLLYEIQFFIKYFEIMHYNGDSFIAQTFIIYLNKLMRYACIRISKIQFRMQYLIGFWILFLVMSSCIIRITYLKDGFGYSNNQGIYFDFDFSSFFRTFITLLYLQTTCNYPDMMVQDKCRSPSVLWLISFIAFLQINMVINFQIAYLFEYYKLVQSEELDQFQQQLELREVVNIAHIETKVHNDVLKKISNRVFEKHKQEFTEEDSPTKTPKKGVKGLDVPHADSPNREIDYKRADSQAIIDKHVKSMEKVWMRYMKIQKFLQWFTFINRFIIVICGCIGHLFDFSTVLPTITTACSFALMQILIIMLRTTSINSPVKRIIELSLLFAIMVTSLNNIVFYNLIERQKVIQEALLIRLRSLWGILCLLEAFMILIHIKFFKTMRKSLQTLWYSVELNYQFVMIIFVFYVLFAQIGNFIFGGFINSETPKQFLKYVGVELTIDLEQLSFNDLGSAMIFLYSINQSNRFSEIVHMLMASSVPYGDGYIAVIGAYIFVFWTISRLLLFTLIAGLVIGIFQQFYEPPSDNIKKSVHDEKLVKEVYADYNKNNKIDTKHYSKALNEQI